MPFERGGHRAFDPRWTSKTRQYVQLVMLAGFDPSIEAFDGSPVRRRPHRQISVTVDSLRSQRRPAAGRHFAVAALVDGRSAPARTGGAGMTTAVECRYYGRDFTTAEMALLRSLIAGPLALNRHALSKEFCRRIGWYKADGGIKDMMARVVMLAIHRDGRIGLPPPKWCQNRPAPITFGARHRTAPVAAADHARRSPPARDARRPRGEAVERVTSPATTTSASGVPQE